MCVGTDKTSGFKLINANFGINWVCVTIFSHKKRWGRRIGYPSSMARKPRSVFRGAMTPKVEEALNRMRFDTEKATKAEKAEETNETEKLYRVVVVCDPTDVFNTLYLGKEGITTGWPAPEDPSNVWVTFDAPANYVCERKLVRPHRLKVLNKDEPSDAVIRKFESGTK